MRSMSHVDICPLLLGTTLPIGSSHSFITLSKENTLALVQIDESNTMHVRCTPLHGNCIAVGTHTPSHTLLYLTIPPYTNTNDLGALQLTDPDTFATLATLPLKLTEYPTAVTAGPLYQLPEPAGVEAFYVVGTSFILPTENEPSSGRLLVVRVVGRGAERRLQVVTEQMLAGGCLAVAISRGKIVAGVGSELQVYDFDPSSLSLTQLCSEVGSILITHLSVDDARGTVAVGDIHHSVSIFALSLEALCGRQLAKLEFSSCESVRRHVTALTRVGAAREEVLVGDVNGNLAVMREVKEDEFDKSNPQKRLEVCEWFHLDDQVNQFVRVPAEASNASNASTASTTSMASEVNTAQEAASGVTFDVMFCTVSGRIGLVGAMSDAEYALLRSVEEAIEKVGKTMGGEA